MIAAGAPLYIPNMPRGQGTKKIKEVTYYLTYKITTGGKFVKIRETKEVEILDPIANQLEEEEYMLPINQVPRVFKERPVREAP